MTPDIYAWTGGRPGAPANPAPSRRPALRRSVRVDPVDQAGWESFPASDPPAWTTTPAHRRAR